ncbi:PREDICTED: putative F-box protein At5g52620 [Camelina sativa]|uniref:F-box protein At5g52620 n=1 Tax=Camelina sativa TaxID=90675 RepID=A0ABM0XF87_CAMSA|nr:PREDICTED: putative F-box protein At5g52620 [Camelina sativa]
MEREDNSDVIPIDIIHEILSRSCNKSIARFGLESKFCAFILGRPEFTELFLTRSSSNQPPRLLFATNYYSKWRLYSCPQPQSPDEDHSLIVSADYHMELLGDVGPGNICGPVSGLLYFSNLRISKEGIDKLPVICNPSTGQYTGLPQLRSKSGEPRNLLGYDPICKQYKVLAISKSPYGEGHFLTVGTGKVSWRKIQCPIHHYPISEGICINGFLYYGTEHNKGVDSLL